MITLQDVERLIASMLHSNNKFMDYGTTTTTTITFTHKFVSEPCIILTPLAASGSPIATVVSKNKTGDFYVSATIVMTGATSVDWIAIGTGIGA